MKAYTQLLAIILILSLPGQVLAKEPATVTWKHAETAPETAEENRAHAEGRAVDINEVNKKPVSLAVNPSAREENREEVRMLLRNMEEWARGKPEIEMFISPIGGFRRDSQSRRILREATQAELDAHWDHIHFETFAE